MHDMWMNGEQNKMMQNHLRKVFTVGQVGLYALRYYARTVHRAPALAEGRDALHGGWLAGAVVGWVWGVLVGCRCGGVMFLLVGLSACLPVFGRAVP